MAFKCIRGTCPTYLTDVCILVKIGLDCCGDTMLCSAAHGDLTLPPTRTYKSDLEVSVSLDPPLGTVCFVTSETLTFREIWLLVTSSPDSRSGPIRIGGVNENYSNLIGVDK